MASSHSSYVDMHIHLGSSRDGGKLTWGGIRNFFKDLPLTHAVIFPIDEKDPGPSYRRMNNADRFRFR